MIDERRQEEIAEIAIRVSAMAKAASKMLVAGPRSRDNRQARAANEREETLPTLWVVAGLSHRWRD
jgi:hypothetical protein